MDWKDLELYSTYEGLQGFIFKLGMLAIDGEVLGLERLLSAGAKGTPNWGAELIPKSLNRHIYLKAQTRYWHPSLEWNVALFKLYLMRSSWRNVLLCRRLKTKKKKNGSKCEKPRFVRPPWGRPWALAAVSSTRALWGPAILDNIQEC